MPNLSAISALEPSANTADSVEMICGLSFIAKRIVTARTVHHAFAPRNETCAMTAPFTVSSRLRLAMEHANLSIADMARRCGVSRTAVVKWLDGSSRSPTPGHLIEIAEATGFAFRWLAIGEGPQMTVHGYDGRDPRIAALVGKLEQLAPHELDLIASMADALLDGQTRPKKAA